MSSFLCFTNLNEKLRNQGNSYNDYEIYEEKINYCYLTTVLIIREAYDRWMM